MTYFTMYHWLLLVFMVMLLIVGLYFILRYLKGQMLIVSTILIFLGLIFITVIAMISLDKVTKKAEIIKLENKRILRNETIVYSGYIVNTGKFTIGESVFSLRLIDHGNATGRLKGGDFYHPVSLFDRLFSNKVGPGGDRPNVIEKEFVIATMLKPGERRKFQFRFRYPPYFKDVAFRTKLENH